MGSGMSTVVRTPLDCHIYGSMSKWRQKEWPVFPGHFEVNWKPTTCWRHWEQLLESVPLSLVHLRYSASLADSTPKSAASPQEAWPSDASPASVPSSLQRQSLRPRARLPVLRPIHQSASRPPCPRLVRSCRDARAPSL